MSGERGFTLVETLIAFAILAVVLVAFYEAMGTGFRTFDRAARAEEAVLIAQSQLDRVLALRRLPEQRQGVDANYAWRLDVQPYREVEPTASVRLVVLRLSVTPPGTARGVAIERLALVPHEGTSP